MHGALASLLDIGRIRLQDSRFRVYGVFGLGFGIQGKGVP